MRARQEQADRSLRLRQSTARLRDMYRDYGEFLVTQYGSVRVQQIAQTEPLTGFILLNSSVLDTIVSEWEPEQAAATDEKLAGMSEVLETIKAAILTQPRGSTPLQ